MTLANDLSVSTYEQTGGTLSQSYSSAATDLTATAAFIWTGGTLNATDNGAEVNISGADGVIDPPDTGSMAIASTLRVISGAVVGIFGGEIEFTGGEGMYIDDAEVRPIKDNADVLLSKGSVVNGNVKIAAGGKFYMQAWNKTKSGRCTLELPLENNGEVLVKTGMELIIYGHLDGKVENPSFLQTTGETTIEGGSLLQPEFGTTVSGGIFRVTTVGDETVKLKQVNVVKDFELTGGTLQFSGIHGFGRLHVEGDVTWGAGTYTPRLNCDVPVALGDSDVWIVTGKTTIESKASLVPDARSQSSAEVGDRWDILNAKEIIGAAPALPGSMSAFTSELVGVTPHTLRIRR